MGLGIVLDSGVLFRVPVLGVDGFGAGGLGAGVFGGSDLLVIITSKNRIGICDCAHYRTNKLWRF